MYLLWNDIYIEFELSLNSLKSNYANILVSDIFLLFEINVMTNYLIDWKIYYELYDLY